jgi:hypothetical protein
MIWYEIPGFPGYRINQMAEVMSLKGAEPRIMKTFPTSKGHHRRVALRVDGKYVNISVHLLMARTFMGPAPEGLQVCHRNGDGWQNNLGNLYYGTQSRNNFDQVEHGTHGEASRTHCDQGHEFTPENTMRRKTKHGDVRKCKRCHAITTARYRARKKAGLVGGNSRESNSD